MPDTLSELVEVIEQDDAESGVRPIPPASGEEIASVRAQVESKFGYPLPDAYYAFLAKRDGACVGSLLIAGTRARPLLDARHGQPTSADTSAVVDLIGLAHEDFGFPPRVLVVASADVYYGWDAQRQTWQSAGLGNGAYRTYRSFEEMLADALHTAGPDVRHLMPTDFEFASYGDDGKPVWGTKA